MPWPPFIPGRFEEGRKEGRKVKADDGRWRKVKEERTSKEGRKAKEGR
jgi:hypothetical protein